MHVTPLTKSEREKLIGRNQKIKDLQEQDICFGCHNFESGDIFPDDGLIFYEDDLVRCQFEKYPRVSGQAIIVAKEHFEDISEMPLDLGTYILKISSAIIGLHKEILGAEKVYMCTICDGKRNHLHFQLFPRYKGQAGGYNHFVRDEGLLVEYHETVNTFKNAMLELIGV